MRKIFSTKAISEMSDLQNILLIVGTIVVVILAAHLTFSFVEEPGRKWMKSSIKKLSFSQ
jgi:peptidoglycan/LPS O-acetylase OafA/YrhL